MLALIVCAALFARQCQALECGSIIGESGEEFSRVVETCSRPPLPVPAEKTENITKPEVADDLEEPPAYGPRRGLHGRYARADSSAVNATSSKFNQSCIAKCIFEHFCMLDSSGFPEHERVSEEFMRRISLREVKDYLQDIIDGCFKSVLNSGMDLDGCAYSTKLALCLAGWGASECADWPAGELPFPAGP